MIEYPNFLNKIFDKLTNNNAKVIIIGGFVRDYLLNIKSDDIDIEVYNISSFEKLKNILEEFGTISNVGKSFGVCKLNIENYILDFTLPRVDSKIASGHAGFNVKITKDLDFATAARRRDFSMNAIGYDVVSETIIDPFNGIKDLNDKTLKMVDAETFIDDPLRVLRAVQFCSRFNLTMDKELSLLCKSMIEKNMLLELPKERIYEEIKKILLKSEKPSIGFELLKELGALKYFPTLEALKEKEWYFSISAIDKIANLNITNKKTNEVLMLAALCHKLNYNQVQDFISNLCDDKKLLNRVLLLLKNLNTVSNICQKNINNYDIYKLSTKVNIEELTTLSKAVYKIGDALAIRAKELNVFNSKLPAIIMGRDLVLLGMKPSVEFSNILDAAYEAQMHAKFNSHDEAVIWLKNYLNHL
ncbi:CCA tRNA nucleotidyltransferase [Sulfurimonas sp.]|uniref:CCA tRNA nucleotidyltransferase n=1 Tax=Sulfurimonas sp. TaxID=2022749 RepID=UPI003564C335